MPSVRTTALLTVLVAAACSTDEPAVIVAVVSEGEPPLGTTLDAIRLTVTRLDGDAAEGRVTESAARYQSSRLVPMTARLLPQRDDDPGRTVYRIRAEGIAADRVIVAVQHRVTFVAARTVTLPLRLEGDCRDVDCEGDRTCDSGGCVDDYLPPCALLDTRDPECRVDGGLDAFVGPDGSPNLQDAAEAGLDVQVPPADDAGDASDPDVGPPDDGSMDSGERDSGDVDSGRSDAGDLDSGPVDSGPVDSGPVDSGPVDAGPVDAGPCGMGCAVNMECTPSGCECEMGFQDCDRTPGCESNPGTDTANCGGCGMRCVAPAPSCIGGVCVMCASAADCDDGLECTTDTCAAGTCQHVPIASRCLIDGACRSSGARNGDCQVCDPARSATAWSPVSDGTRCNDGQFCTLDDTCEAGVCTGTGSPCGVNITYRCVPQCNESTDTCTANFGGAATYCYIDRECVHESWTGIHPTNQCLGCEPLIDRFDYSPRQTGGMGDACDDGLFCTATDVCTLTATPSCVGSGSRCDDGLSCTTDSCNEGSNSCTNTVTSGFCAIGGVCYANGEQNPANECQRCTSSSNPTGWTNKFQGAVCGGGGASCCDGTCHPCSDTDCACMACTGGAWCGEIGPMGRCACM